MSHPSCMHISHACMYHVYPPSLPPSLPPFLPPLSLHFLYLSCMGPRVSRSKWRRSDCTSCLAYLESTFLLLGFLGVNIFFVNKGSTVMLNLQSTCMFRPTFTSRSHEEFSVRQTVDWTFGDDEDDDPQLCYKQVMSFELLMRCQ